MSPDPPARSRRAPRIGMVDPLHTRREVIAASLRAGGFDVVPLDGTGPGRDAEAADAAEATVAVDGVDAVVLGTEDDGDALGAAQRLEALLPGRPIFVLPNSVGDTPPSIGAIHGVAPSTDMDTFLAALRAALADPDGALHRDLDRDGDGT